MYVGGFYVKGVLQANQYGFVGFATFMTVHAELELAHYVSSSFFNIFPTIRLYIIGLRHVINEADGWSTVCREELQ